MTDNKTNLLFVCSRNQWRSPTAEALWRQSSHYNVRSAGTSSKARKTIKAADIQWADIIFVMEKDHKARLRRNFSRWLKDKRVISLDIPDNYEFMAPELIQLLERKVSRIL